MERVDEYPALQEKMIASYRSAWGLKNLPFYFVQLSSIDSVNYKSQHWQQFRAAQFDALQNGHHVGMAVSMDKGAKNDVHPTNKKDIAQRLASFALHDNYGFKNAATITKPIHVEYKNGFVSITFNNRIQTLDGDVAKGFSLDGIHEASYVIKESKVFIKTPSKPALLYFGFSPYTSANLVDKEGTPIPAFILPVQ
jgi:sialate O-acetylesterase